MKRLFLSLIMCFAMMTIAAAQGGDMATEEPPVLTLTHDGVVTVAAWNADDSQIMTAGEDNFLRIWDAESGDLLHEYDLGEAVRGALYSPDYSRILAWTDGGGVYHVDVATETVSESLPMNDDAPITGAAWRSDGEAVLIWTGETVSAPMLSDAGWVDPDFAFAHNAPVLMAAYNADETHIQSFSETGFVRRWEIESGEIVTEIPFGPEALGAVWAADEDTFVVWALRGFAQIVDAESREALNTLLHRTFINGARFSVDESLVMTWAADDTVKIWEAASGAELASLMHNDWVNGAVWDAEETRVLSWSFDSAWLWESGSGELLARLPHDNVVNGAAFNADETQILTWGWDGAIKIWDVAAVVGG